MNIKRIQTKDRNANEIAKDLVSKCRRISTHFLNKEDKNQKYSVSGLKKFKEMIYDTVIAEYASKIGFGKDKFNYDLANELKQHAQFYDAILEEKEEKSPNSHGSAVVREWDCFESSTQNYQPESFKIITFDLDLVDSISTQTNAGKAHPINPVLTEPQSDERVFSKKGAQS